MKGISAQHLHSSTPFQALLLLTQLTKNNTNLQKIVAFENGYDHIFAIIKSEGYADGGVVVEDCLILMLNLLRNNPSNQTFFKEGECVCVEELWPLLPCEILPSRIYMKTTEPD